MSAHVDVLDALCMVSILATIMVVVYLVGQ